MLGTASTKQQPDRGCSEASSVKPTVEEGVPYSLLALVQELSHARTLESVVALVRDQARDLLQADGVTFVLRDGAYCHYVEENAIGPLWKGRKFPLHTCISGWAMLNRKAVAIEDIYQDERIPLDAYRVTFVKSLAMVPIRRSGPIGAIGAYWAAHRHVTDDELLTLQALADSVSIAMENVALYAELQAKVKQLQDSNYELGRFAWVASHDLQEPLRTITTQVQLLEKRYGEQLDARAHGYIEAAVGSAQRLQLLVEDLLVHARIEQSDYFKPIVLRELIGEVMRDMQMTIIETGAEITLGDLPWLWGERVLMERLFQNLLANAIKFRKRNQPPRVRIDCVREEGSWHITVRDEGIGIPPEQCERIFGLFQRVHAQALYPGSGIGLATCKKIVDLHQGRIWVASVPGEGSTFHIVLPLTGEELHKESAE